MRISYILLQNVKQCVNNKPPPRSIFLKAFNKYLFITNTVSSGLLMGIGDFFQQKIEQYQQKPAEVPYDIVRTKNLMTVGLSHGVFHHYFYSWLDRIVPYSTVRGVLSKVLLDQIIAGPCCITIFFFGMGLLNTGKLQTGYEEFKKKFAFVYGVDWLVWPPTQFLNFYYVPLSYRVVYINFITMLYNIFLSYAKHFVSLNELYSKVYYFRGSAEIIFFWFSPGPTYTTRKALAKRYSTQCEGKLMKIEQETQDKEVIKTVTNISISVLVDVIICYS